MAFDGGGLSGTALPNTSVSKHAKVHMIKIRLHHKGYFVSDPEPAYIRGETYEVKGNFDIDSISTITLCQLVKDLGYPPNTPLWYLHPVEGFSSSLRQLHSDKDVITFINFHKGHEYGDIFLENSEPYFAELVEVLVEEGAAEEGLDEEGSDSDFRGEFDEEYSDEYDDDTELDDDAQVDDNVDANSEELEFEDSDFDEDFNWTMILPDVTQDPTLISAVSVRQGGEIEETTFEDFEDEDGDSEELETPDEASDEESVKTKYPKYKGGETINFELEQTFATVELVRKAVKDYGVLSKKNVYMHKNDKKRIVVKCAEGCSFYMRISKSKHKNFYQVVSLEKTHTCYTTGKNRQAKTKWLAKEFVSILRHTPNMKIRALQDEAKTRWSVMLSRYQAYRAKTRALKMIEGGCIDQYRNLRSYGEELINRNRGSTIIIKSEVGVEGPVFSRMYVCFKACKTAFATCCRPLIGLDGCFLKGLYGGQLLTAVGKDGNNQMCPIAFAIVEAETKDSWSWFVQLLLEDLNSIMHRRWSFISDQQKGLVDTLKSVDVNVEHRFCVKHLYGNLRKKYPGEEMKQSLWIAARATTVPEWEKAMENMKKLNEEAWKDMSQIPPSMWSRSAYSTHTQCDLQVNNMCEAFNKAILEYRDKPIISLVEGLKYYMTSRIVRLRDYMLRYEGEICPKIQKILEKSKKDADGWTPMWSGDLNQSIFSVSNGIDQYVVNLVDKTCACRRWELSGIPCVHAISCLWYNNTKPEDFVAHWYRKTTFVECYNNIILPNNGPKLWPKVEGLPIQPPYVRRAPGRPKKARRKANDEPNLKRMKKAPGTVTCTRCNGVGHNKRSCKGKTAADRLIPIGGNKSNTSIKHPEAQPSASVSQIQIQGSKSVSQIGAQSGKNATQTGANTTAQSGVNTTAQTGAQSAKNAAQTDQNVTTSNAKKGAKRGRKKKNEDAISTQQSINKS